MSLKVIFLALISIILFSSNAFSQDENYIKVTAKPSKLEFKAGEEGFLELSVVVDEYWYTYSMKSQLNDEGIGPNPTEIVINPSEKFEQINRTYAPVPYDKYDEGFEMQIHVYKDEFTFYVPFKAKEDLNFSDGEFEAGFYLQLCDTTSCLPPAEYIFPVSAETFDMSSVDLSKYAEFEITYDEFGIPLAKQVGGNTEVKKVEKKKKESQTKTTSALEIEKSREEGVLSFLFLAMAAGGAALLTPCVFPMVPITVSFFTKRSEQKPGRGLVDSLIYSLGIIITFTLIGFIVSLIWGATGIRDIASNGFVNILITLIFIILALNLFGAFEIQIPPKLLNYLNAKSQDGSGIISIILMSVTFSLTSFTCTVPFVAAALGSASTGDILHPIIGMLGFSGVFAAPFFLLALFPSYLQKLPKAGGWMNNVKVVMGFLEIAAAIKFLSNADLVWGWGIMPREIFLAIWVACGIFIIMYIMGKFRLPHDAPIDSIGPTRIMIAVFFAAITIWLFNGMYGKQLGELDAFLPPKEYNVLMGGSASTVAGMGVSAGGSAMSEESWHKKYASAVKEAKETNKPIFIDFTGVTCTNCRWMESNMFTKPAIASLMNDMVKAKLYTDRRNVEDDQQNKKMQEDRYGSIELPLYVILTPDEEFIASETFTRNEKEFLEFLKSAY